MRQRHAQRFGNDLRCGRRPQELASAAGRSASAASRCSRFFQRDFTVGKPCPDGLHFPRVFACRGGKRHSARNNYARQVVLRRQGHHHRGQTLVACRHANDTSAGGQRPDQSLQYDCGIVAKRQAVHHADGPLRPAVAGVADVGGKRQRFLPIQFLGRRSH